jgi:hypothetical protein
MNSVDTLASRCLADLQLDTAELDGEYGYAHLPFCIIDAVWSIGVRYSGVQNVIARYRSHFRLHAEFACSPHTIDIMLREMDNEGALWFAREVFQNMQRTSTRGGILKAEAIHKFAGVLQRHGMNTLEDVPKILWYEDLDREIAKPYAQELLGIPGQRSGISLSYSTCSRDRQD